MGKLEVKMPFAHT